MLCFCGDSGCGIQFFEAGRSWKLCLKHLLVNATQTGVCDDKFTQMQLPANNFNDDSIAHQVEYNFGIRGFVFRSVGGCSVVFFN